MRAASHLLIAAALAAAFTLPAHAGDGTAAQPAAGQAATADEPKPGEPRPTDAELARLRLARCQQHPEICVQKDGRDGKGEKKQPKEKPDPDGAAPAAKPPPESVPR